MKDRRKIRDRRAYNREQDRAYPCNRRYRPCRRLNNISASWVPLETVTKHPVIWRMFRRSRYTEV